MATRQSQRQQPSGSNPRSPAPMGPYQRFSPPGSESSLIYGSQIGRQGFTRDEKPAMYQRMDRAPARVPELDNRRSRTRKQPQEERCSSTLSRWLGRPSKPKDGGKGKQDGGKQDGGKLVISAPQPPPISTTTPPRPARPPIDETPASFYGSSTQLGLGRPAQSALKDIALPQIPSKPVKIRPENLGRRHEALGSHPVASWLDDMQRHTPASRILTPPASGKGLGRGGAAYFSPDVRGPEPVPARHHDMPPDTLADRRRGKVFASSDLESLQTFPDPDTWQPAEDEDGDYWDDAGFDDEPERFDENSEHQPPQLSRSPETHGSDVPEIRLTPPKEGYIDQVQPGAHRGLSVDDCYKNLYKSSQKEIRQLQSLQELVPLAWLISKAQGFDLQDRRIDLKQQLEMIIEDRDALMDLLPLAETLAQDQSLSIEDLQGFPQVLKEVFHERDSAKFAAGHHKRARKQLEGRIRQLESEKRPSAELDEETYMR